MDTQDVVQKITALQKQFDTIAQAAGDCSKQISKFLPELTDAAEVGDNNRFRRSLVDLIDGIYRPGFELEPISETIDSSLRAIMDEVKPPSR